jgi:N-acetylneuraminic acid mutarotase
MRRRRFFFTALLALLCPLLLNCGGGGGGGGDVGSVGSVSPQSQDGLVVDALKVERTSVDHPVVLFNWGGGTAQVYGSVIADPGEDVVSLTSRILDEWGNEIAERSEVVHPLKEDDPWGHRCFISFTGCRIPTTTAGTFTVETYVTDSLGRSSNITAHNFTVLDLPMWKAKRPIPTGRSGLVAVAVDNEIYALGGLADDATGTNERYDPVTDTWHRLTPMPTPRYNFAAGVANGKIYAIGGEPDTSGPLLTTVEEYDPATDTWTRKSDIPVARYMATAASANGNISVIGLVPDSAPALIRVDEYDPATDSWTRKSDAPGLLAAVSVNGKIYGFTGDSSVEYDAASDVWTSKAGMPFPCSGATAAVIGGKAILFAARCIDPTTLISKGPQTFIYDPSTNTWETKTAMPTLRDYSSAAAVNGKAYVIGGEGRYLWNENEEYDPLSDP